MADKSKMTVAEILAAARKQDGGGAAPTAKSPAPAEESPAESAPAAAPKPAAPAKKPAAGGRPSVADMMAMARGEKSGAPAAKPAAPKPAAKEAAPKPAAAKAAPKQEVAAAPAETQSILTAARKGAKPGPMTKADAAAKGVAVAPKKPAAVKETIVVPPMPVKPDYAKAAADRKEEIVSRRAAIFGFSALALGFVALSATIAAWTLGTVRFMFPNVLRLPPSKFKVGFPDTISMGQVEEKYKAGFGVWIVKTEYNGQPQLFALKSVCTHLGCTPNWLEAEQKFKCPCHGSGFYKDGINFEGPAPRPLERYAISIGNDGQVEVDKSRTFHEEMGQWSDSSSFIPA